MTIGVATREAARVATWPPKLQAPPRRTGRVRPRFTPTSSPDGGLPAGTALPLTNVDELFRRHTQADEPIDDGFRVIEGRHDQQIEGRRVGISHVTHGLAQKHAVRFRIEDGDEFVAQLE